MANFLGVDTSNYTTSLALLSPDSLFTEQQLLHVKEGVLGLRQSEAVFQHTKVLPELYETLSDNIKTPMRALSAVGVSSKPRSISGSYMPCFLSGYTFGRAIATTLDIPLYEFSHQQGHIAAAVFGSGEEALFMGAPFLTFHLSGGTTDGLLAEFTKTGELTVCELSTSLDLKAGQAVDRVGKLLGLPFPAGLSLDALAVKHTKDFRIKAATSGMNVSLSGIENQCQRLLETGETPENTAYYCIKSIYEALRYMTVKALARFPDSRLLYCGGVMSNSLIQKWMTEEFSCHFVPGRFSCDNAIGIAYLTKRKHHLSEVV